MYPTLILGCLALALSIRSVLFPNRELTPLIVGTGAATLFSGGLGAVTGFMATFNHIQALPLPQQFPIALLGISESLNNVSLALIVTTLVALLAGIGAWRARHQTRAGSPGGVALGAR